MAKRILIRDVQPNQLLEGVFAIQNCQIGQTKNGKPYLKCLIADRSKRVPGRMWNISEELFNSLPTDGFVYLEGQTQPYQGEMQIIIQQIHAVTPAPADLLELLPRTERDIEAMFTELTGILRTVQHPALLALLQAYLTDQELIVRFKQAPAAMTLHHAFLGGLLEHTLALLRLAEVFCPLYPQLNRDIIIVGLFIHDLGKCAELTWETGFNYSDDGQLIGHVARGVLWLQQKAQDCERAGAKIPPALLMVLQHIILSHHGKAEFGALKVPATPEAIAISNLDNLDAKLQMAIAAARAESAKPGELGGNFTEKVWALDTRIYRPDPTRNPG